MIEFVSSVASVISKYVLSAMSSNYFLVGFLLGLLLGATLVTCVYYLLFPVKKKVLRDPSSVILPDLKPVATGSASKKVPARPRTPKVIPDMHPQPQYRYFVAGSAQPFTTLRDALSMFPAQFNKDIAWEELPKYIRKNVRREDMTT